MPGSLTTSTPSVQVTSDLAATLVESGGYTHPLFHPADSTTRPLPGQAVLLLMGGLVEQSGVLDHAIALLEIRQARFTAMVRPGARLRVEVAAGPAEPVGNGRARQEVSWTAYVDGKDGAVATAEVLMLVSEECA
jgi:acyl dehydratase